MVTNRFSLNFFTPRAAPHESYVNSLSITTPHAFGFKISQLSSWFRNLRLLQPSLLPSMQTLNFLPRIGFCGFKLSLFQ